MSWIIYVLWMNANNLSIVKEGFVEKTIFTSANGRRIASYCFQTTFVVTIRSFINVCYWFAEKYVLYRGPNEVV